MSSELEQIVTAIASGAAGSFAKETITNFAQWIKDRFAHHSEKAKKKAAENANDFLSELVPRLQKLEENSDFVRQQIENAMSQPDVSILMQQALLSAAQTENKEKHILLAQLVTDRLQTSSESLLALTTPMACEAISHLTDRLLRILGFYYSLQYTRFPTQNTSVSPELLRMLEVEWAVLTLTPYKDLQIAPLDLMHLNTVACLSTHRGMLSQSLKGLLQAATSADFDYGRFLEADLGPNLQMQFEGKGLGGTDLTSTGSLIGLHVSDLLANRPTDTSKWEV